MWLPPFVTLSTRFAHLLVFKTGNRTSERGVEGKVTDDAKWGDRRSSE